LKQNEKMVAQYQKVLDKIPSVTRNEASDAIDQVLNACAETADTKLQEQLYNITSAVLAKMPDTDRMLFDVRMKLCKTLMTKQKWEEAQDTLDMLHKSCLTASGEDDKKGHGGELIEIYAMNFRLSSATQNSMKMKELYERTKDLTAAVSNPHSQSVIKECWGIMFGDDGNWTVAKGHFFQAFLHYGEIGNADKAKQCLKYYVIAHMLSNSDANPFDQRETQAYAKDPEIVVIISLRNAYEKCDVPAFGARLYEINKAQDPFIMRHIVGMTRDFQSRAIVSLIRPYRRIRLQHLADQLNEKLEKIEEILVALILDGQVDGRIDQVRGMLDLSQRTGGGGRKYGALDQWTRVLTSITSNLNQPAGA